MKEMIDPSTIQVIVLLLAGSALVLVGLAVLLWLNRAEMASRIFMVTVFLLLLWTVGLLFEIIRPTLEEKIFWQNIQYIGITFVPLSMLALSLYFTQQSRYINRWLVWLGILPAATNIVIWTDRWHSLFRVNPFIDTSGSLPIFTFDAGFWFRNLHSWYGYALMAATLFFLVRALIGSKPFYQRQIWAMINGMALPILAHTLFLLGQSPLPRINLTPITFGFSGIIVGIAIVRYRLFYVLPLAKDVVFESLDAGIIVYDAAYRLVDLNLSARRITGLSSQQIGLPIHTALAAFPDLVEKMRSAPAPSTVMKIETNAEEHYYRVNVSDVLGPEGQNAGYVTSLDDISELVHLYDEVEKLATFDALTGAYNRRVFIELSNKEIAKTNRYIKSLCLILMDVDQFKQVNDTYGHLVGDQLLLKVADICVKNIRKVDIFGRYGGDEFILLLPETGLERAQMVAERLRRKIHQIRLENTADTCLISASFGLTCAEAGKITNLEELMLFADRALYVSKHQGGNSVSVARIEPDAEGAHST